MSNKNKIIDNPTTMLHEDINDLFHSKKEEDFDILFSVINLILCKNERNTDMIDLFNIVDMSTFIKLLKLFNGRNIHFIESTKFTDALVLSIVYYLREIEHIKDWDKVQEYFGNYTLDRLSLALKIHNLDEFIKQKIQEQFRRLNLNEDKI